MDVVATKALVKDHDWHVGDRAEICELLSLKWAHATTSFLEDVAAKVLDGSNGIHDKSWYEEENDPAFLWVGLLAGEVWIVVCPVADSEAFHNECIEEESEVRADDLEALNLVELINEEKICYMQLKGLMNVLRSKNLISLLEHQISINGEIRINLIFLNLSLKSKSE